jgi:tetratricopeptide (TPR) repeat protein
MMRKLLSMGMLIILIAAASGCSTAGSYYKDGKKSFAHGDYEKAADCYSKAIEKQPYRADYYIDYGLSLVALGRYEEALDQFDRAYINKELLLIKENNKRALRGKGITYYNMMQYEKAIEEFAHALEINELTDLDMDILYYMANSMNMTGSYDKAIETYTSLLSYDKKNASVYSKRALCYRNLRAYEKSLEDYEKAISLEPKNYDHYYSKYYLMVEQGDDNGAAEVLSQAQEIPVITSQDKYNLAKLHYLQGDYDKALSEFSEGYASGFTEAYYYIGEIYRIKKDYTKAIYYYESYIDSKEVKSPNVYNQMAICLIKSEEYEDALQFLEKGMNYHDATTLKVFKKNEIIVYEKLGRYEEARVKMEEYQRSYPEDSLALREAAFIDSRVSGLGS